MLDKLTDSIQEALRRHRKVMAFALLGVLAGAALGLIVVTKPPVALAPELTAPTSTPSDIQNEAPLPVSLRMPSIDTEAVFGEPLGVNDDYTIQVPESFEEVGWYQFGPVPGEQGPAVVLGHVDSYKGPAIFYRLGQLEVGDEVIIAREDGSTAVFIVERLERHEQSGFPTEKVYSDLEYPGLRLITCSGTYDRTSDRYSHNLIVFARLDRLE